MFNTIGKEVVMSENFNIKELSSYLKCSIAELRKLVKNNDIPYYRIGKKLFFKKTSIEYWIEQKEQQCSSLDIQ